MKLKQRFAAASIAGIAALTMGLTACGTSGDGGASSPQREMALVSKDGQQSQVAVSRNLNVPVDTRDLPEMPALSKLLPKCPVLKTWDELKKCAEDANWYHDGVDRLSKNLGFDWNRIVEMAGYGDGKTVDARVIVVHKWTKDQVSEDAARKKAAELIGDDATAKDEKSGAFLIPVVYVGGDAFLNTWRTNDSSKMTDFADYNAQIRVELGPTKKNADGNIGFDWDVINRGGGVAVDCINAMGWFDTTPVPVSSASPTPSGSTTPGTTTPGTTTPGTTTPGTTTPTPSCPPELPHRNENGDCKDDSGAGPAHNSSVPAQRKPNPLPASPSMAQTTRPSGPQSVYTPPAQTSTVVVPPPNQGGPTQPSTPRTTAAPQSAAPTEATPSKDVCIPAPGKSCPR